MDRKVFITLGLAECQVLIVMMSSVIIVRVVMLSVVAQLSTHLVSNKKAN
jgi:hypothetical protein